MKKQILILQSGVLIPLLLLLGSCSKSDAAIEDQMAISSAEKVSMINMLGPNITIKPSDAVLEINKVYQFTAHNIPARPDNSGNSGLLEYTGWVTITSQVKILSSSGNVMTCMFPAPGQFCISYHPYAEVSVKVVSDKKPPLWDSIKHIIPIENDPRPRDPSEDGNKHDDGQLGPYPELQ